MPVELTILSGAREGACLQLDSDAFRVGDDPAGEVYFDPGQDPAGRGRVALVLREESGWRIENAGNGPLLLNHTVIDGRMPLRSGDIIRLSDMGPDVRFTLVSATRTGAASAGAGNDLGQTLRDAASPAADIGEETQSRGTPFHRYAVVAAALALLSVVTIGVRCLPQTPKRTSPPSPEEPAMGAVDLDRIPSVSVREGELLTVQPKLSAGKGPPRRVEYSFVCDAPPGMRIDPQSGEIRWTPGENQGPGEYRIKVRAAAGTADGAASDAEEFAATVQEVNAAPAIAPLPDVTFDPAATDTLPMTVQATDPDVPPGRLTYALGSGAPDGLQVDPATGQLTWKPAAEQCGRTHTVAVRVQDDGTPPRSSEASFRVTVPPFDPWKSVVAKVAPAVCLLVIETPEKDRSFPIGTACAIREDVLLTNAVVAAELQSRRLKDWQVKTFWPSDDQELPVREILVHKVFNDTADAPSERIYWELAILRLDGKCKVTLPLAGPQELAELEEGFPLVCAGIPHDGTRRTRFVEPRVEQYPAEVYVRTRLSAGDSGESSGAPTLLHLRGTLPQNLYGSPLVNAAGHVVGVYAEKAAPSGADAAAGLELHYAPLVTLARAFLAGQGLDDWTPPECPHNQTPTPSPP